MRYPNSGQQATQQLMRTLDDFFNTPSADLGLARGVRERNLGERVATILLSYARFGPMSHNKYRASSSNPNTSNAEIWGSLEDIHNSIHGRTGGGGHMGFTSVSAFDPIFWLHHTQVSPIRQDVTRS